MTHLFEQMQKTSTLHTSFATPFTARGGKMCPERVVNFPKGPYDKWTVVEGCCHPASHSDAALLPCPPPLPRPLWHHRCSTLWARLEPPTGQMWPMGHKMPRSDPKGPYIPAMDTMNSKFVCPLNPNFFKNWQVYVLPFKEKRSKHMVVFFTKNLEYDFLIIVFMLFQSWKPSGSRMIRCVNSHQQIFQLNGFLTITKKTPT